MTKYHLNGPPRCPKCFQYYLEQMPNQQYCLACSLKHQLIDQATYDHYISQPVPKQQDQHEDHIKTQETEESSPQQPSWLSSLVNKVFFMNVV